jgi:nitroimidazol reductase NimA-like FMN-containing flavoprotein (pyridoxamine 5'-phosphate oxidase superfamily)
MRGQAEESMSTLETPRFTELGPAEAMAVLARNYVGRLAFLNGNEIEIQPVHYVFGDGWIFGRTSAGDKVAALRHNWRCAFEVDEIDGLFDWRSVVVRGGFYLLSPTGTPTETARWQRAVEALRRLIPDTLTEADPVPFRNLLFGIAIQELQGRSASTGPGDD